MKTSTYVIIVAVALVLFFLLAKPRLAQAQPVNTAAPGHPLPLGLANARGVAATVTDWAAALAAFKSPFAGQAYTPAQIQAAEHPVLTTTATGGVTFFG